MLEHLVRRGTTGEATIELAFSFDTDVTAALLAVNNALNQVRAYPETVRRPQVVASAFSSNSFMFFWVSPPPDNPRSVETDLIADFVDRSVRSRMESVPGASNVGLYYETSLFCSNLRIVKLFSRIAGVLFLVEARCERAEILSSGRKLAALV